MLMQFPKNSESNYPLSKMQIAIPKVGSVVKVITRHKNSLYYSNEEFRYSSFEGTVVTPDKWMSKNDFSVMTGKKDYPISTINIGNVFDIQYISGSSENKLDTKKRTFKVFSKKSNKNYTVVVSEGSAACDCVGFSFRRTCKHVTKVLNKIS